MIWQLALITLSGFLGSSHCISMCGGFAMMIGMNRTSWHQNLRGQLAFSLGRIASYCTLGAFAGFAGKSFAARASQFIDVPAFLCLLSGLLLLWEGLKAAGVIQRGVHSGSGPGCLFKPLFAGLLKHPALRNSLSAGIFVGFLPCGLVYAFVSLAASSGDMIHGIATMTAFGLGTMPLLITTGLGVGFLGLETRRRLWQVAAWSVVITGALTLGRGAGFILAESPPTESCPFCSTKTSKILPPAINTTTKRLN